MSIPPQPGLSASIAEADPAAIVADVESRARRFETPCGDGVMVWHAWGEGPPLLLMHGSHGSWSHWIRNVDALGATRTVWVPDLPNHGDSAGTAGAEHEDISRAISEGLRLLIGGALPVDTVGFSFGGVAAAHLAALHPAIVRRLVIVGCGGLDTPMGDVRLRKVRGLEGDARREAVRSNLLGLMLHHPDAADDLAIHLQEINIPRARLEPRPLVLPDRLIEALPRIACPLGAIWGEQDIPHPVPEIQEAVIRRYRPDVEFRTIAGAGHWAMYEKPRAFDRTLADLLEKL